MMKRINPDEAVADAIARATPESRGALREVRRRRGQRGPAVYWTKWRKIAALPSTVGGITQRCLYEGHIMCIRGVPGPSEGEYGVGSEHDHGQPAPAVWRGRRRTLQRAVVATWEGTPVLVEDGDTLICCCSWAAAAEGRCHRAWAAKALLQAGWDNPRRP